MLFVVYKLSKSIFFSFIVHSFIHEDIENVCPSFSLTFRQTDDSTVGKVLKFKVRKRNFDKKKKKKKKKRKCVEKNP